MEENKKGNGQEMWKIIGMLALIVVLFLGIKLVYWGLEKAIPQTNLQPSSASQSVPQDRTPEDRPAPSFCVHCGGALPERFQWGQFCPYCGGKVE